MSAAEMLAGAAPGPAADWHSIDWKKVYRTVRRLQARIVKAVQAGRWGKVKALVHLLTHSFSGRALAILRVVTNSGARTPGVDGILWDTPEAKTAAFSTLRRHGYQPQPLHRVYIPKSNGKMRPLGIPMALAYCTSLQATWGNDLGRFTPPPETRKGSVCVERLLPHGLPLSGYRFFLTPTSGVSTAAEPPSDSEQ
jgi:hypothetical protein